ncbi:MAG: tyrosine-type recombinase/integrase [Desulfurococcaceae archaeon]
MIETYLSRLGHLSPKTLETKRHLLSYLEAFGDIYTQRDISEFIKFLKDKGLKDSTIRKVLTEASAYLEYLGRPLDFSPYMKTLRVYRRAKPFSDEELKKFFSALKNYHPIYYVFSLVLLHSGIRVSEALALTSEDFEVKVFRKHTEDFQDYVEKEVLFVNVRRGKFGKPYRAGMVLLEEKEKDLLKRFIASRKGKPLWAYTLRYPKSVKEKVLTTHSVHKFYERLSKELGFEIYPHRFRYTYASMLLAKGFSTALVQSWLGHESPNTTLLSYARAMEEVELERWIG